MKMNIIKNSVVFILLILLTSCQFGDNSSDNLFGNEETNSVGMIQPADLSDETKRILGAIGMGNVHIFELTKYDKNSYTIRSWVEIFENGVKQEDQVNFSTGIAFQEDRSQKPQVIFSYHIKKKEDSNERIFSILSSMIDNSGTSSSSSEIVLPENSGGSLKSSLSGERKLIINQPVTVITMIEDNGNGMFYNTDEFINYDENNEIPKDISRYGRYILFRIALEKDEN